MGESTQSARRVVRFGVFEVDLRAGELRRSGVKIKLQDQPFQILALLLERPGDVVTREEIQHKLWPADTFVDFEHSLNAAVKRLREALGDSADNPRFVETIPRRGYRFIYPLEGTEKPATSPKRKLWLTVAGFIVVAAVVVGWYSLRASPLTESDYILLTDFVNTTGDPVFDRTLKQGLAVKLGESPFLNVFPQRRVQETLRLMEREPDAQITESVGREICERQGIKAMLLGEIAPLGSHYVITLDAVDCRTGDSLAREQVEADGKEEVLASLGKATSPLRRKLGESLASVEGFDTPLRQATTSSLEALRAYTLGQEQGIKGRQAEAILFFERAIELDPNFAEAHRSLGVHYSNLGEMEKGATYIKKAFELRERATENEKLSISTVYYDVTGEVDKQIEVYEVWEQLYPRGYTAWNNHAVIRNFIGQYAKAAELVQKAMELNPERWYAYNNLAVAYMGLNRFDDAKAVLEEAVERKFDSVRLPLLLYGIALVEGDTAAMQRYADWAVDKGNELWMLERRADAAAFSGKLQESRELRRQAVQVALRQNFKEIVASLTAKGALLEAETGNAQRARASIQAALRFRSLRVQVVAAELFALLGDTRQAQELADDLNQRFPKDTLLHAFSLPTIRARIEIRRGSPARAVELLQSAVPYELGRYGWQRHYALTPVHVRGKAYLQAGMGAEAATQFQKILDHRGVDPTCPLYALAHLGLARAYALAGETTESRQTYEDFLTLWKDADPDIPIFLEAKAEYAKLLETVPSAPAN